MSTRLNVPPVLIVYFAFPEKCTMLLSTSEAGTELHNMYWYQYRCTRGNALSQMLDGSLSMGFNCAYNKFQIRKWKGVRGFMRIRITAILKTIKKITHIQHCFHSRRLSSQSPRMQPTLVDTSINMNVRAIDPQSQLIPNPHTHAHFWGQTHSDPNSMRSRVCVCVRALDFSHMISANPNVWRIWAVQTELLRIALL